MCKGERSENKELQGDGETQGGAISRACLLRKGLTLARRGSWQKLILTTLLICLSNVMLQSNVTPKLLAAGIVYEARAPKLKAGPFAIPIGMLDSAA